MKNPFKKTDLIIAIAFIVIGVLFRLMPHAPNFAPVSAMALFAGAYLSKRLAIFVPLLMMIISDFFIGFYDLKLMFFVYVCFFVSLALGFWLKNNKKKNNIVLVSIFSSLIFFFVTNFAVWVFTPWYAKTIQGLVYCYFMALPFFRNTLLGDLFYTAVFFGAFELAVYFASKTKKVLSYNFIKK